MKLSTKGRYGLRALIDLARYSGEAPVSTASISERQDISERYLEQLMSLLKKAELVKSVRGAGGGYMLAKDMDHISVGDVLRALEGSLDPVECAASLRMETVRFRTAVSRSMSGSGSMTVSIRLWMRSVSDSW